MYYISNGKCNKAISIYPLEILSKHVRKHELINIGHVSDKNRLLVCIYKQTGTLNNFPSIRCEVKNQCCKKWERFKTCF